MLGADLSEPPQVVAQGRSVHGRDRAVDEFELPDLWSLHLYQYDADLEVDGTTYPVTPGSLSLVRPATPVRYRYRGPSPHLYAHVRAPVLTTGGPRALVVSAGPNLPVFTDLMTSAVASAVACPERTRADVWLVLLRLRDAVRPLPGTPGLAESYVAATMSYVEAHLAGVVTVPQIARTVGVSPDHLTRVFSRTTGQTVAGYVRRRRVEHAVHLLTRTTMSVSAVAAAVGIPDLQAFNKTCRAVTGRSPRRLREQG
ncbi:helix-turn-helix domain-containing protein [Kineococcus rhizosphaerae]|uniref:AraC-like DNA-binding protein n=1 Tax=Kineococcus rhizosphaerae TaxID=559628 RepID=A0A2T0R6N2_9ACTN|nr:helix-turn-helix transcriptional regulator [Kineococcus rhizosphaerae]PRY16771.1 AraC-like DNA-binding protein [Kineococcus rhizosphaerae]